MAPSVQGAFDCAPMFDRLEATEQRYDDLTQEMARPEVAADYEQLQAAARERASIEQVVELYREWKANGKALDDARAVLGDRDPQMAALSREEVESLSAQRGDLEARLKRALVPKDPRDERDVIMEIRAGTGGDEAALFAADLYRMY